jgi:hypothetical protein
MNAHSLKAFEVFTHQPIYLPTLVMLLLVHFTSLFSSSHMQHSCASSGKVFPHFFSIIQLFQEQISIKGQMKTLIIV